MAGLSPCKLGVMVGPDVPEHRQLFQGLRGRDLSHARGSGRKAHRDRGLAGGEARNVRMMPSEAHFLSHTCAIFSRQPSKVRRRSRNKLCGNGSPRSAPQDAKAYPHYIRHAVFIFSVCFLPGFHDTSIVYNKTRPVIFWRSNDKKHTLR